VPFRVISIIYRRPSGSSTWSVVASVTVGLGRGKPTCAPRGTSTAAVPVTCSLIHAPPSLSGLAPYSSSNTSRRAIRLRPPLLLTVTSPLRGRGPVQPLRGGDCSGGSSPTPLVVLGSASGRVSSLVAVHRVARYTVETKPFDDRGRLWILQKTFPTDFLVLPDS